MEGVVSWKKDTDYYDCMGGGLGRVMAHGLFSVVKVHFNKDLEFALSCLVLILNTRNLDIVILQLSIYAIM